MFYTRRDFLKMSGCGAAASVLGAARFGLAGDAPVSAKYTRINSAGRRFHVSTCCDQLDENPDFPEIWHAAGITDVWVSTWFYGHYPFPWEKIDNFVEIVQKAGMNPHFICVPFCHGGGALDPRDPGKFPNLPPKTWKMAKRFNGSENWGFSYHAPADRKLKVSSEDLVRKFGPCAFFLDDDFRFAPSPGEIGGCVCDECRAEFLKRAGLPESRWDELVGDWSERRDTPLIRSWCDYVCDKLTACFRMTADHVSGIDLGIMVMFMGSERAGIRLPDYSGHLMRVGEMMFSDSWFDQDRNKTRELFSSLFHARYGEPGRLFSETTVYPEGTLSCENMAAKLAVSTFSDVRNTMFMSGLRAIPADFWPALSERAQKEKAFHDRLVGRCPVGPFKHFWGMADRYMPSDEAYSLFLATGVPFEVCGSVPKDGWTFLGDASACEMDRGELESAGSKCLARIASESGRFARLPESYEDLFRFRRSLLPELRQGGIPFVEEEVPVVLGWYPEDTARSANGAKPCDLLLLWNISKKEAQTVHVRVGEKSAAVSVAPLQTELVEASAILS